MSLSFEFVDSRFNLQHEPDCMNFSSDERKLMALTQMNLYIQENCLQILDDPRVRTNILMFPETFTHSN